MRYLYVCPSCQKAFSDESAAPLTIKACPNCGNRLVYANCTKEDWDLKTQEEKQELKLMYAGKTVEMSQQASETTDLSVSNYNSMLSAKHLENIDRNIASIKSMMTFFTILAVIGIIIALYAAAKTNQAIQDFQSFFY